MQPEDRDSRQAPDVDRLLREALEPDPAAVGRAVGAALRGRPRSPRIAWAVTAAAALALVTVVFLVALVRPPRPVPPPPIAAPARPLTIANEDGIVTVTTPDGARLVVARRNG